MNIYVIGIILLVIIEAYPAAVLKSFTASDPEYISDILKEQLMHPDDKYLPKNKLKNMKYKRPGEETNIFWLDAAKDFVQQQLKKSQNLKQAKNIVFFLGDGLGVATIAATRVYNGGEEIPLFWEEFPYTGLSKTYCVDTQVADSSSTATAYLTGVKTNYGVLGLNARVPRFDCKGQLDLNNHTHSIGKWAQDAGKVAGFVTTTKITDASPGGIYAHSANRYWENDEDIVKDKCDPKILDDVAKQLIYGTEGSQLRVMLGGGRQEFRSKEMNDEEGQKNKRTDNRDLINEWLEKEPTEKKKFVWNATDLMTVNAKDTDYLLGMFEGSHCRYHLEVVDENIQHMEPTLAQMTEKAIEILSKHDKGFFLFVEGGRIDLAHHGNYGRIAIDENAEFAKAIKVAKEKLSSEDTLFVVTADHSHLMSYSGYAYRSNDIFDEASTNNLVFDNIPFLTLNYFDGPGNKNFMNFSTGIRQDPTKQNIKDIRYQYPASVLRSTASHGGEDVIVFADGPWSHLFTGVLEQSAIPHIMAYAACIGNGKKMCDQN